MNKVDELFTDFQKHFEEKLDQALKSGALPDGIMESSPYVVYRAVLLITAESYAYDMGPTSSKVLKNLRHFI